MKIIIFAGGTGKRFWPASRKESPKQFQPVVGKEPLVKLKYNYLRIGFKPEDMFLSTGMQYKEEVENILPEIPKENFIYEPSMRDNGPAVALAVAYVQKLYSNEVISIQWADHYLKYPKVFIKTLKVAEKVVKNENKSIIVGVPPRFPSPHRGHIKFGKKIKSLDTHGKIILCEFIRFIEKPTLEVAKQYVRAGNYAWNTGYLISTPNLILETYKRFAPTIYRTIKDIVDSNFSDKSLQKFSKLEKIGFDYVFSENLDSTQAYMVNSEIGWSDVGEWVALQEALSTPRDSLVTNGNTIDLESTCSLIYNYENKKLVATIGLKDMVVVNTPDVVAVFHKDDNKKLKELLKKLEDEGKEKYL